MCHSKGVKRNPYTSVLLAQETFSAESPPREGRGASPVVCAGTFAVAAVFASDRTSSWSSSFEELRELRRPLA